MFLQCIDNGFGIVLILYFAICRILVLDVIGIVPTCRVLVEQEHLLDLCREQRYDLAEHSLERMAMMTSMMMILMMMSTM